jgi:hypothetical protein
MKRSGATGRWIHNDNQWRSIRGLRAESLRAVTIPTFFSRWAIRMGAAVDGHVSQYTTQVDTVVTGWTVAVGFTALRQLHLCVNAGAGLSGSHAAAVVITPFVSELHGVAWAIATLCLRVLPALGRLWDLNASHGK